jgi:hypothetical protein
MHSSSNLWLALALVTLAVGCGGGRRGGTPLADGGTSVSPVVTAQCAGLCSRAVACYLDASLGEVCRSSCAESLAPYGAVGEAVLTTCVTCLDAHTCDEIPAGGCAAECPSEVLGAWEAPPVDAGAAP